LLLARQSCIVSSTEADPASKVGGRFLGSQVLLRVH